MESDPEDKHFLSRYATFSNNSIMRVNPLGDFGPLIHGEICEDALKSSKIEKNCAQDIILGSIAIDIYGSKSDYHFDNRENKSQIDDRFSEINREIRKKLQFY